MENIYSVAREAYELGFDEVEFDYIRFPEGLAARTADYAGKDLTVNRHMDCVMFKLR